MRHIAIVYKNDEKAASLAHACAAKLEERGCRVWRETSDPDAVRQGLPADFKPDLIISMGGDGTLLYSARTFGLSGTPLLGVNMGQLGFLTETETEHFEEILHNTLAGDFQLEQRFALSVAVKRADHTERGMVVLNDVVIHKGHLARIMPITVSVPGGMAWSYRADGLIVATPTGSTAYNLSAGGPVVHPSIPATIVTPICPFTLTSRPLILPAGLTVEVTVDPKTKDPHLSGDGQVAIDLEPHDRIVIRHAPQPINLISNPRRNFLEILRHKLNWTA